MEKIDKHCYQTDIANTSLWVNNRDIIIGEKAKRLFNDMTPSNQFDAFSRVVILSGSGSPFEAILAV